MNFKGNERLLIGEIVDCYIGYSNYQSIRKHCASGGIISNLLIFLLDSKIIDGALVCRSKVIDNKISYEVKIVTCSKDILDYASSVYFNIPLLEYIPNIKKFYGKIAFVGLPCQIRILRNLMKNDIILREKVFLIIGLFCGHNSRKNLLIDILNKKGIREIDVKEIIFRQGLWRGNMQVTLKDDKRVSFPFQDFSTYQNLHFDSLKKCLYCVDHTAEDADISCGDAWLSYLRNDPIKHSLIVTRTDFSNYFIHEMRRKGDIFLMQIEPEIIYKAQKRSLISHKSIEARSKIGKIFGYSITCPSEYNDTARWNDYLASFILLINIQISSNKKFRKHIFFIPRIILYSYLFLFKSLTSF